MEHCKRFLYLTAAFITAAMTLAACVEADENEEIFILLWVIRKFKVNLHPKENFLWRKSD